MGGPLRNSDRAKSASLCGIKIVLLWSLWRGGQSNGKFGETIGGAKRVR